jgi:hypothetical protein
MHRRVAVPLLVLLLLAVAPAAPAGATRAPTAAQARAIRAAALRTLHGSGWRVSHIRLSSAHTTHRYARAVVTHARTGAGGTMLLATSHGRWRRRFLGSEGFCGVLNVPQAVLADLFACPDLAVRPSRVAPGGALTVTGRNWPAGATVALLLGPARSEADPVGTAVASPGGRISATFTVNATLPPGAYVVLGCLDECRTKARAPVTLG